MNSPNETVKPIGIPVLPFMNVNDQKHFRASSGVSMTFADPSSLFAFAIGVAGQIVNEVRQTAAPENVDAEHVSFERVAALIEEEIWTIELLAQSQTSDIAEQKAILRDCRNTGTTLNRLIREAVQGQIVKVFEEFTRGVRSVSKSPFKAKEKLEKLCVDLKDLNTPVVSNKPSLAYRRLSNALPVLRNLAGKNNRSRLEPGLRQRVDASFRQAVSEQARSQMIDYWKAEIRKLRDHCEKYATDAATIRVKLEAIFESFGQMHKDHQSLATGLENTIQLTLPPVVEAEIERAAISYFRCDDTQAMVDALRDSWEERMGTAAQQFAPAVTLPASFVTLATALPVEVVCQSLVDLIEDAIANDITIYTRLASMNVESAVKELHRRSKPMVRLEAYEKSEELNILPTYSSRVTLPTPKNVSDAEILREIQKCFRRLDPQVEFVESEVDREISVLQLILNFPIGVEANNTDLLIAYARAAARGHTPHLIGVIDGSNDGEAIEALIALAQFLFEE